MQYYWTRDERLVFLGFFFLVVLASLLPKKKKTFFGLERRYSTVWCPVLKPRTQLTLGTFFIETLGTSNYLSNINYDFEPTLADYNCQKVLRFNINFYIYTRPQPRIINFHNCYNAGPYKVLGLVPFIQALA